MLKITVKVDGMMCGMCEAHVNDAVRKLCKVKKVTSSHSKGETVIITGTNIPDTSLKTALEAIGYKMLSASRESYEKKGLLGFLKK